MVADVDHPHDHHVLVDLVDDAEVAASRGVPTGEGTPQRRADAVRVLGQRAEDERGTGRRHHLRQLSTVMPAQIASGGRDCRRHVGTER